MLDSEPTNRPSAERVHSDLSQLKQPEASKPSSAGYKRSSTSTEAVPAKKLKGDPKQTQTLIQSSGDCKESSTSTEVVTSEQSKGFNQDSNNQSSDLKTREDVDEDVKNLSDQSQTSLLGLPYADQLETWEQNDYSSTASWTSLADVESEDENNQFDNSPDLISDSSSDHEDWLENDVDRQDLDSPYFDQDESNQFDNSPDLILDSSSDHEDWLENDVDRQDLEFPYLDLDENNQFDESSDITSDSSSDYEFYDQY